MATCTANMGSVQDMNGARIFHPWPPAPQEARSTVSECAHTDGAYGQVRSWLATVPREGIIRLLNCGNSLRCYQHPDARDAALLFRDATGTNWLHSWDGYLMDFTWLSNGFHKVYRSRG